MIRFRHKNFPHVFRQTPVSATFPPKENSWQQIPTVMAELEEAKKTAGELLNRWEFLEEVNANSPR